jgi:PAS domain S-box-containing protein
MTENDATKNHSLENQLIDALFDEDRDILILTTDELEIEKINQSASINFGLSTETLVGRNIESLFTAKDRARLKAIISVLRIDGETINTHFDIEGYLGTKQQSATSIRYVQCETYGQRYYLFVIRRAPRPIPKPLNGIDSEQLIQRLLKGLSDSVLLIDMVSRTISDCNLAAEAMFGYARADLIGRSPQFLAPDEEAAKDYVTRGRESYAKTGYFQDKMVCRRKDGFLFMTLATNIALFSYSGEQNYVLAINRDLTQEETRLNNILRLSEQSKQLMQALSDSILPLKNAVPLMNLRDLGFNDRQIDIAAILETGETTKVIAGKLHISESAIKNHLSIMYRRVGVASRMEFVKYIHDHQIRIE